MPLRGISGGPLNSSGTAATPIFRRRPPPPKGGAGLLAPPRLFFRSSRYSATDAVDLAVSNHFDVQLIDLLHGRVTALDVAKHDLAGLREAVADPQLVGFEH
ncbi:hypothetical protein DJ532_14845, partial [Sulfolobus sp. A20-N-F8]